MRKATIFAAWQQWKPWQAAAFVNGIDFGAILLIRYVFEGKAYLGRWPAYYIGDSMCLPAYAACVATATSDRLVDPIANWYDRREWYWRLFAAGTILSLVLEANAIRSGRSWKEELLPSQIYHTGVFGVVFTLLAGSVMPLVKAEGHKTAKLLALAFFILYAISWFVHVSPHGGRPEFDSLQ